jgi:3-hydroxyacyl-[acyl-carrier-protein] dehydratase
MDPEALQGLVKSARRKPLWTPPGSAFRVSVGRKEIESLLPHRDPFLLLDDVTEVSIEEQAIRGRRRVDPNDPVFRGHFPENPIYPGVLQMEILGQLGLCLLHFLASGSTIISADTVPRDVRVFKVHFVEFLAPVGPGDELTVVCRAISLDDFTGTCAGQILRGDTICALGIWEGYFVDE